MANSQKQKKILLLVSSPFQYWCAQEYLHQFGLERGMVSVVNAATFCDNSMNQIEKLHKRLPNLSIHTLAIPKQGDLEERIKPYAYLTEELSSEVFDFVLLGDLRQIWMQDVACSINADNTVLIDDGAATNVFVEKLIAPAQFTLPIALHEQNPTRKQEALNIKEMLGLQLNQKRFTLYSVFPFDSDHSVVQNRLSTLKSMFDKDVGKPAEEIHFIGSPVAEKGIVTAQDYEEILRDVVRVASPNSTLFYFVHRAENLVAKGQLLKDLGFKIEIHDEPYELICAKQNRVPQQIVGMHSTSLFNMRILFGDRIDATCYQINKAKLKELGEIMWGSDKFTLKDHIESIYRRLDEFNITARYPS